SPKLVRHLDLETVAVGPDVVQINGLKRASAETFVTAGRIAERHAGDDLHVFGGAFAEHQSLERPVHDTNAITVTRAKDKIGVSGRLQKFRDIIRVVRKIAVHLQD